MTKRKKKTRGNPMHQPLSSPAASKSFSFGPSDDLSPAQENARTRVIMHLVNYGGGLSDMSTERMDNMAQVVNILFEDLSRESDIISLITEREIISAEAIREGLRSFDQHPMAISHGSL